MSPPTTLTGIESSPSQMVPDGLPNINLESRKLQGHHYWDITTGSSLPSDADALDQFAKVFGIWAIISGISIGFAIIILALIGVLP